MHHYYFVATLLPSLSFESPPEINFSQLERLLNDNLTPSDLEKTKIIRRYYDLLNLRAFWQGEEFDIKGDLSRHEIEEAIFLQTGLPQFVYDYLERYENLNDRLRHFPLLLSLFFKTGEALKDPFLHRYLKFERELRLVMTAFRAKTLGRDLAVELQYEDPEDDLIAQILAQKDAESYEPPEKYKDLKGLFDKYAHHPLELQREIDHYRFDKIDSFVEMADTFSIERILAYLAQFFIIEKWQELDQKKGQKIVEHLMQR
jgi:hypothetical protein